MIAINETLGARSLASGLHYNIPAAMYHADQLCERPSLSSGVARTLVDETPAHARLQHPRLGGRSVTPTPDMILGSAVHALIAGGFVAFEAEFAVGDFDNYTTKIAREWRDGVEASGKTPILRRTLERAEKIVAALREKAAPDLTTDPFASGDAEVTAIWHEDGGVVCRARYDRLILDPGAFADVWDWKTTGVGVSASALERQIIDHGYHVQAAFYLRGLAALLPEFRGRLSFILVFVETEAPFAVRRVPITEGFLSAGNVIVNRAIARWRKCLDANEWPDDSGAGSLIITPPAWYLKKLEEAAWAKKFL